MTDHPYWDHEPWWHGTHWKCPCGTDNDDSDDCCWDCYTPRGETC